MNPAKNDHGYSPPAGFAEVEVLLILMGIKYNAVQDCKPRKTFSQNLGPPHKTANTEISSEKL